MLSEKSKYLKTNEKEFTLNKLNDFMIKIDYFDQKGTKNSENIIPLKHIFISCINNFKEI